MSFKYLPMAGVALVSLFSGNLHAHTKTNPATYLFLSNEIDNQENVLKIAKATFLPETYDDLGLSYFRSADGNYNKGDNCNAYSLTSCPDNGLCSKCPFNPKQLILASCKSGFKKNENKCLPEACSSINQNYLSSIPKDNICSKISEFGLTCFHSCSSVNCSQFPIICSATVENAIELVPCPDCNSDSANCSPSKCKVAKCIEGLKPADDGASCIPLNDDCQNGYYKTCSTGTVGEPQYTEKGTPCYKCQARTCSTGGYNLNIYWCDSALKCVLPAN